MQGQFGDDRAFAVEIQAELDQFERNMRKAGRLVETTTSGMDKQTRRAQRQFERLEGALDPVARAALRLERDTMRVQTAMETGAVTNERAAAVLQRLNQQYERATVTTKRFEVTQSRAGGVSRSMSFAVQQAGFQVGDFAVQIASGQNPLRAFIQQGTQMISMFGPMGAVIGAGGAIVGALVTSLGDLDDATESVTGSTRSYNELMKLSNELTGDARTRAIELAEVRRVIAKRDAEERVRLADEAVAEAEKEIARIRAQHDEAVLLDETAIAEDLFDRLHQLETQLEGVRLRAKEARLELDIIEQQKGEFEEPAPATAGRGRSRLPNVMPRRRPDDTERLPDDRLRAANQQLEHRRQLARGLRTAHQEYLETLDDLHEAHETGFLTQAQYERGVQRARTELERATETTRLARDTTYDWAGLANRALDRLADGTFTWRDALSLAVDEVQRLISEMSRMQSVGSATSSGGGFFSGLFNAGLSLFGGSSVGTGPGLGTTGISQSTISGLGFADGGRFKVNGAFPKINAGRDNRLVQFAARDGEQVTVSTPGRPAQDGGGGMQVNMTLNNPTRDMIPMLVSELRRLGATVTTLDRSIEGRATAASVDAMRRDPSLRRGG